MSTQDEIDIDKEKVKFLANNLFPQNWKGYKEIQEMIKKLETVSNHYSEDFITDEAGLYTLLSADLDLEIHIFDFDLIHLIERRFSGVKEALETLPEPQQDERYYSDNLFKVNLIKDKELTILFVYELCYTGFETLLD